MKCMRCGVEKEVDKMITDFHCDCHDGTERYINMCIDCFDLLNPDMWTDEDEWNSINPVIKVSEMEICYPY